MSNVYSKGTTLPRQQGTDEDPSEANMSTATASTPIRAKAPAWAEAMRRVNNCLMYDFGGGPRPWKFAWVINFQKTGTFPLLAFFTSKE